MTLRSEAGELAAGPRGLLIDFDGTLADSLEGLRRVYWEFLRTRDGSPTDAEFQEFNGVPLSEALRELRLRYGWKEAPQDLEVSYRELIQGRIMCAPPSVGAPELLRFAAEAQIEVAVVSSAPRMHVLSWLGRHSLKHRVRSIVSSEDVSRGKPHPDPYVVGLRRLKMPPRACVAVEDSEVGLRSAVSAHLETFLVGVEEIPERLKASPPTVHACRGLLDVMQELQIRCSR